MTLWIKSLLYVNNMLETSYKGNYCNTSQKSANKILFFKLFQNIRHNHSNFENKQTLYLLFEYMFVCLVSENERMPRYKMWVLVYIPLI